MLETLITSKTRLKLLLKFFLNSNSSSYLRELESEFHESTNAIRLELNRFEEAGLLQSQTKGNKKFYHANTDHPLYPDINSILLKYNKRFLTIIGMCYYWMNENEEAVSFLKEADDLEYYPYRTKKFLALAYYRLNDLAISLEYAEDAIEYGQDGELKQLIAKLKREENVMKGYKDLGTENFLIQFSREEHDETRTIVSDYLKEAYKEIGKELDYFPKKQFVVILYNERDFFDVTRAPGWAGGLYDGKIRLPVRGLSGPNDILRNVIFHEFTHALVSEITQKCPLWINEGLAEYFSSDETNLNIEKPIPLKYLEKGFPSGNVAFISLAYRTSHSAVSYMIDKYGMYSILELLENFGEGMDINKAFESVLYISYDDFVFEWGKQF